MAGPEKPLFAQMTDRLVRGWHSAWVRVRDNTGPQVRFWFLALMLGLVASLAAIGFRLGIEALQAWLYHTEDVASLRTDAARLQWWWILLIPTAGGLIVGIILDRFTSDGRVHAVADVIEGAALYDGRVRRRQGFASVAASFITLSTGGSSGREGPVVHLAGVIATFVSRWTRADGITGRDLLGCAVAAAVSASFNAPIAGALFAMEVVLRHFAVSAFAPIVIASVSGTVMSRMVFGDQTEFLIPNQNILAFYTELPAFVILGLVCGVVSVLLMRSIFLAEDLGNGLQQRLNMPRYLRPMVAGLILGAVAIFFPHIIGVGYETTSDALHGSLSLHDALVFAALKIFAVAVTIAGRMGGGVFSPALMIGALTGLAFGIIATGIFPDASGESSLYALAGMGAVAAAVLGAPISTTLIVFELTGDWQTGIAVMVSVSLSAALASRFVDHSFFLTQLDRRGVHLAAGPQAYLLGTFQVASVMRGVDHPRAADPEACADMVNEGTYVTTDITLDRAMPLFDTTGRNFIPVVAVSAGKGPPELRGALFQVDALRAFNRALSATVAEEHR